MLEWLFWQVGNLGPMAGQLSHFVNYAQGEHPYSHKRYADEYNRCLGVLERRLEGREFILGEYSIADMASWPWVLIAKPLGQPLDDFPNVARWRAAVRDRPAVQRGVDLGKEWRRRAPPSDEERKILFNQTRPDRRTVIGHVHGISFSGKREDAFPSGHALHMGALASAASALPAGPRRAIRALAVGLSLTRIVVLAHWASDVVAGFALGAVLERFLRLWTGYPLEVSKEDDHADS